MIVHLLTSGAGLPGAGALPAGMLRAGMLRAGVLGADVPATPSAQEARRDAQAELAKGAYRHDENLLVRIWRWLGRHLDPTAIVPGVPPWVSVLIVVALVVVAAALLVLILRRVSRAQRVRGRAGALFDDERDAAALAASADAAAARGDWTTAVVERFRAIIRSLDERGAIEDFPGLTAHEAGGLAAGSLPSLSGELTQAAALFDAVRYGRRRPTTTEDQWMRALADRAAAAPVLTREAAADALAAPWRARDPEPEGALR